MHKKAASRRERESEWERKLNAKRNERILHSRDSCIYFQQKSRICFSLSLSVLSLWLFVFIFAPAANSLTVKIRLRGNTCTSSKKATSHNTIFVLKWDFKVELQLLNNFVISKNQFLVGNFSIFFFCFHSMYFFLVLVRYDCVVVVAVAMAFVYCICGREWGPLLSSLPLDGTTFLALCCLLAPHSQSLVRQHNCTSGKHQLARNTVLIPLSWLFYSIFYEIDDELKRQLSQPAAVLQRERETGAIHEHECAKCTQCDHPSAPHAPTLCESFEGDKLKCLKPPLMSYAMPCVHYNYAKQSMIWL